MAIPTHIAVIGSVKVPNDGSGDIKIKSDDEFTLSAAKSHTSEFRVLEDLPDIPNTVGNPTQKEYIELEGGDDYQLMAWNQSFIVTQLLP